MRGFRLFRSLDLNVLLIHFLPFPGLLHCFWELGQHRWPPACPGWHGVPRITRSSWCNVPSSFPPLGGKFSFGRAFSTCGYLQRARCEGKGLEESSGPAVVSSQTQPLMQSRSLGNEGWNGVGISERKTICLIISWIVCAEAENISSFWHFSFTRKVTCMLLVISFCSWTYAADSAGRN